MHKTAKNTGTPTTLLQISEALLQQKIRNTFWRFLPTTYYK